MQKFVQRVGTAVGATLMCASLTLAGCSPRELDPQAETASRQAYTDLRSGNYAGLEARLSADAKTTENMERFRQMGATLPKEAPGEVRAGPWQRSRHFDGADSYETILTRSDYIYGNKTVHVEAVLTRPIEDTAANKHGPFLLTAENKPTGDGTFRIDDLTVSTSGE